MVFTGTFEHAIDGKQRVAIPSKVRAQVQRTLGLADGDPMVWVVTLGDDGCLALYTAEGFNDLAESLRSSDLDPDELLAYERLLFTTAEEVETDRTGRVRLPERLLEQAGLAGEVVILGNNDHLEIRDRQAWNAERSRLLTERPDLLMNPRRALRMAGKRSD
ncbi:MAG: hypothetical protein AAF823_03640 [Planctomycetota bacterium]